MATRRTKVKTESHSDETDYSGVTSHLDDWCWRTFMDMAGKSRGTSIHFSSVALKVDTFKYLGSRRTCLYLLRRLRDRLFYTCTVESISTWRTLCPLSLCLESISTWTAPGRTSAKTLSSACCLQAGISHCLQTKRPIHTGDFRRRLTPRN